MNSVSVWGLLPYGFVRFLRFPFYIKLNESILYFFTVMASPADVNFSYGRNIKFYEIIFNVFHILHA